MPDAPANLRVTMRRPDLEALPAVDLPPGCAIRAYQPGDEAAWLSLHLAADPWHTFGATTFAQQFGTDEVVLAARQLYLCTADGAVIGTSTAWYGTTPDDPCGRVHWVAIHPSHQGRGLGLPLLAATLHRLRALGHRHALLVTSTARLPALRLYLRCGFAPDLSAPDAHAAWRTVLPQLPQLERFL